jgi:hypothetical protein
MKKYKEMKRNLLIKFISKIFGYCKNKICVDNMKYSFSYILILKYFNINVPEDAAPMINYSFGVFILSLISLLCFINIMLYFSSIY